MWRPPDFRTCAFYRTIKFVRTHSGIAHRSTHTAIWNRILCNFSTFFQRLVSRNHLTAFPLKCISRHPVALLAKFGSLWQMIRSRPNRHVTTRFSLFTVVAMLERNYWNLRSLWFVIRKNRLPRCNNDIRFISFFSNLRLKRGQIQEKDINKHLMNTFELRDYKIGKLRAIVSVKTSRFQLDRWKYQFYYKVYTSIHVNLAVSNSLAVGFVFYGAAARSTLWVSQWF